MGLFDSGSDSGDFQGDLQNVDLGDYVGGGVKKYRNFLRKQFGKSGRDVGQIYRDTAYNTMGEQQRMADIGLGQSVAQNFGWNAPTGLTAALQRRNALEQDYAGAALASKEAARRTKLQMGQALQGSKQAQVNWASGINAPWLQEQGMLSSMAAGAGAAGGSSAGSTIGAIGSGVGSLVQILGLFGV